MEHIPRSHYSPGSSSLTDQSLDTLYGDRLDSWRHTTIWISHCRGRLLTPTSRRWSVAGTLASLLRIGAWCSIGERNVSARALLSPTEDHRRLHPLATHLEHSDSRPSFSFPHLGLPFSLSRSVIPFPHTLDLSLDFLSLCLMYKS